jgi:hypothetical protein
MFVQWGTSKSKGGEDDPQSTHRDGVINCRPCENEWSTNEKTARGASSPLQTHGLGMTQKIPKYFYRQLNYKNAKVR